LLGQPGQPLYNTRERIAEVVRKKEGRNGALRCGRAFGYWVPDRDYFN